MKSSILITGILAFAVGIVLSLPSLILEASQAEITDKDQAINFVTGSFVNSFKSADSPGGIFNNIPSLLVLVGIILLIVYLFMRFFVL